MNTKNDRLNEWFVPKFGPRGFRIFVGMLFLPYTGMCISFAVLGSMVATPIAWERVLAISVIYALGLGIAAHAADSLGSKKTKPWGNYFSDRQLWFIVLASLSCAYSIGIYYMIFFTPMLWIIAILEGFFVFAYNFEIFGGFFHTNFWFSLSWGSLPVIAGFIIQTNHIEVLPIILSAITGLLSYIHIRVSRRYKQYKREGRTDADTAKLELVLKNISLTTITAISAILILRTVIG
jgi:hypothetical protein